MSLFEDIETRLPFHITVSEKLKNKAKFPRKKVRQKRNLYPALKVETLPKSFGKIDKNNRKRLQEMAKEEEYLLNFIAKIAVEIFIKEEL